MFSKLLGFSNERHFLKWEKVLNFDCKTMQTLKTVELETPKQVRIHLNQHEALPCVPIVKKGDEVKIGQVIAECAEPPVALVHASISGSVVKIDDVLLASGIKTKAIIIESDELQQIDPKTLPPLIHQQQDLIEAIKKSGIPALNTSDFWHRIEGKEAKVDTLLVNATQLEPFVTTPIREVLTHAEDVLTGMKVLMKWLTIKTGIIAIEKHQTEGITCLSELLTKESQDNAQVSLKPLPANHASGSADLLIQACGEGLSAQNVLVLNVETVGALARYLETGLPCIHVNIPVMGAAVHEAKNVLVPIGTPIKDVIAFCGGYKQTPKKILLGGPLTGDAVLSDEETITKQTTALFAFGEKEATSDEEAACIRCARCLQVCPVALVPVLIDQAVRNKQLDELKQLNVDACTECGHCSFICPANRHLVQTIKLGKSVLQQSPSSQSEAKGAGLDE